MLCFMNFDFAASFLYPTQLLLYEYNNYLSFGGDPIKQYNNVFEKAA